MIHLFNRGNRLSLPAGGVRAGLAVSIATALVLLVAAGLKIAAQRPSGVIAVLVIAEVALAGWLLSLKCQSISLPVTAGVFVIFGVVNVATLWAGGWAAPCGCFGTVAVPPWMTLLLDAGVVWWIGHSLRVMKVRNPVAWRPVAVPVVLLLAGGVSMGTAALRDVAVCKSHMTIGADGYHPLGEPEQWGRCLPVAQLANGSGLFVVYDRNCEKCREAIEYAASHAQAALATDPSPVVFVDVSDAPFAGMSDDSHPAATCCTWAGITPAVIAFSSNRPVAVWRWDNTLRPDFAPLLAVATP